MLKNILQDDTAMERQTHEALLKVFTSVVARALETNSSELAWVSETKLFRPKVIAWPLLKNNTGAIRDYRCQISRM